MRPPSFVSRALGRLAAVGAIALVAVWLGGIAVERVRLGGDASAARANVQAAVSEQVASLEARLQDTIAAIGAVTELVQRAEAGDAAAQRQLFERTAAAMPPGPGVVSITVYGESRVPIAWTGRPAEVPGVRIDGPDAVFLGPGPQGLRLVRIYPLDDEDLDRRVGTLVLETLLTQRPGAVSGGYVLETPAKPDA